MTENKVREYRERMGMTQVELSRKAKVASPNLSNIENQKLYAWAKVRKRLAKVLKVTEAELFPGEVIR